MGRINKSAFGLSMPTRLQSWQMLSRPLLLHGWHQLDSACREPILPALSPHILVLPRFSRLSPLPIAVLSVDPGSDQIPHARIDWIATLPDPRSTAADWYTLIWPSGKSCPRSRDDRLMRSFTISRAPLRDRLRRRMLRLNFHKSGLRHARCHQRPMQLRPPRHQIDNRSGCRRT